MSAASAGHVDVVKLLVSAGASANVANDSGAIPLHYHKVCCVWRFGVGSPLTPQMGYAR
jgi:hypothetical protein